jgi:Family of unknown function (DUF6931)
MGAALVKLAGSNLEEVRERLDLPGEATALVTGCTATPDALERLESHGFLIEAVRLLAHALPKREATWWACMCAHHTAPTDLPAPDRAAVAAAEQWVRRQTDEPRRAAFAAAQQAGFGSPEAWAAVAAFWSGESMSPLGQPAVPPAEHLTGTAVAGAVALAAVRTKPERQKDRLARFLDSAHNIAAGGPGRLPPEEG